MKKLLILTFGLLFMSLNAFAAEKISISLEKCEEAALNNSHKIKSLEYELKAARSAADSQKTSNYPFLVLEGSMRYVTNVQELNNIKLGDNWNYSVGPAIYWTAFDGNVRNKNYKSFLKAAEAKEQELEYNKREILLSVRTSYFKLISALKNIDLLNQQLNLSISQNKDVRNSIRGGASTKLDGVISDADVLNKQKQIKEAQILLIDGIKEVNDITGGIIAFDMNDHSFDNNWNDIFSYAEPKEVLKEFEKYKNSEFDKNNPSVLSLEMLSQYYAILSESLINSNYPIINLYAKSTIDYPNGPVIESYNRNTVGGSFSVPLYQFGKNKKSSLGKKYTGMSYEEQKQDLIEQLSRLFDYSKDKIKILEAQKELNVNVVVKNKEAAHLMYQSYKAGESKFLDVETMNLKVIESQTNEVNIYAGLLIQLAVLASLGGK